MKRTTLVVEQQVQKQKLGTWTGPDLGLSTKSGYLIPYGKSSEDMEVFLRYSNVLKDGQFVELCGFSIYTMVKRATALEESFPFNDFRSAHPVLVSFPPDVIWLGREKGAEVLNDGIEELLPPGEQGFEPSEVAQIAQTFSELARSSRKTYGFWQGIVQQRFRGVKYSKLLMEYAFAAASRVKAKAMTGIVPVIDPATPGSVSMAHRTNLAYIHHQNDLLEQGASLVPAYLYTIQLNSGMVKPDKWTPRHRRILQNAKAALQLESQTGLDGVHLSVRGIDRISQRRPRVAVLLRFIDGLREICDDAKLPLFWGRSSLAGLGGLDYGVDYASCPINLGGGDVYSDGGPRDELPKFGNLLNVHSRDIWNRDQLVLASEQGELPDLGNVRNMPTDTELENPHDYRLHFSKPYNVAGIRYLAEDWVSHTRGGEIEPGREYLQTFDGFAGWSAH